MERPYNSLLALPIPGGRVPTVLRLGDVADAQRWDREIQPHIAQDKSRPDADWHWASHVPRCQWIEKFNNRRVVYAQYAVRGKDPVHQGQDVLMPVGQALYSIGYPFPGKVNQKCTFVWYVAATPKDLLAAFGIPRVSILKPLIDLAIQISSEAGFEGRIALHADPKGGDQLVSIYKHIGLENIDKNVRIGPVLSMRPNDGRYFCFEADQALAFASQFNEYRLRG